MAEIRLLLVTGSTRRLSTNSAALRTARELLNDHAATVYDGLAELPAFNPDNDHEPVPEAVSALRALIADVDAGRSTASRRRGSTLRRPDAAMARMLRFVSFSATWERGSWYRAGYAYPCPTTRSAQMASSAIRRPARAFSMRSR